MQVPMITLDRMEDIMMKKEYIAPSMDVINIIEYNIVTASNPNETPFVPYNPDETPMVPFSSDSMW